VGALIDWAFFHHPVLRVAAETYPELRASIRVMEKNGLGYVGPGADMGVVRYELTRSDYEARGRNGEGTRGREPAGT
jgi:RimJ/RimL family protein N-acetyltransferase